VEAGATAGYCQAVNSAPITFNDPNLSGSPPVTLGFSGKCVTVVSDKGTPLLYASTTPIDLNGAPLTPSPGDSIVIADPRGTAQIYVRSCKITTLNVTGTFDDFEHHHDPCPNPTHGAGELYLGLGGGQNQNPPGIAGISGFDATMADRILGPLSKSSLQPTNGGHVPNQKAVTGCGLYKPAQPWGEPMGAPKPASGAQYDGFNVATAPCVTLTTTGQSRIAFWDSLPSGFGDAAKHQPSPTSQVVLQGQDVPPVSSLQTTQYANVARARAGKRPPRRPTARAGSRSRTAPTSGRSRCRSGSSSASTRRPVTSLATSVSTSRGRSRSTASTSASRSATDG
jgi:hypothetical protein